MNLLHKYTNFQMYKYKLEEDPSYIIEQKNKNIVKAAVGFFGVLLAIIIFYDITHKNNL